MTDFDDILADLELKLTETQMGTPQPAAPKVSKPSTNPVLGRTTSTSNGVPSLNTKAAASRPVEPPLPSPGISLDSFSELDALVESLNKPSTPKMTTTPSQSNLTKPAATPPKQSNPNPVRQPSSAGLPKAPTKTPSTNNLPTTAPPKVAATAPKMAAAPPKVAPAPMHTPAPTPTPTPAPSFNTQASSGRLTDSDPVQKLAQVVATNLGRDAASVQQWMDIFRRNEIETVGDLTALRPDDWPRLGLPLRIERAMRDALSDTGGAAPSNPVVPPLANPGAPKLPLNNVNRPQPVTNQPLRSPRGSQSGVACRNCQQPIMGEHLIALGHHYHKEHFTCSTCSKLLQSNQFFADGDAIKCANCIKNKYICCRCGQGMTGTFLRYSDGRYVHQTCLGAGKCGKCGHEVTGPQLEALGQIWHATCFTCTRCNINLSAEFLSVENKPYCKSCVGALTKSRVNDPIDSFGYEEPPQPQAQRQPMTKQPSNTSLNGGYGGYSGGGSMSRSNSENFLNDTPRSNSSRLEDTFSDGESDMDRVVCSRCLGTITDAEYIALSDKQLHKDCFNCDNCEAKLDADNFYEQDGQLLCEICVNVLSM